jgi:uncharacterized membrane protein YesL
MSRTRTFLWLAYDHMGGLVAYNMLWSVLNLPYWILAYLLWNVGVMLGGTSAVLTTLLTVQIALFSPPSLVLYIVAAAWVRRREIAVGEVLRTLRHFFFRAQILQFSLLGASALLSLNIAFYKDFSGWLGLVLSGLMLWLLLALALIALQLFPLLVTQDIGVRQTLHQSLLLAIGNIGSSVALLLVYIVFCAAGILTGVGLFCGFFAAYTLWASAYYRGLLSRYTGEALPVEEPRQLSELIRPWGD